SRKICSCALVTGQVCVPLVLLPVAVVSGGIGRFAVVVRGLPFSVSKDGIWTDATGPNRYRRAVYTYIKRTSGYPSFLTFDASDHDVSLARRIPTNTPLQALVTLNDTVYQETSAALAKR